MKEVHSRVVLRQGCTNICWVSVLDFGIDSRALALRVVRECSYYRTKIRLNVRRSSRRQTSQIVLNVSFVLQGENIYLRQFLAIKVCPCPSTTLNQYLFFNKGGTTGNYAYDANKWYLPELIVQTPGGYGISKPSLLDLYGCTVLHCTVSYCARTGRDEEYHPLPSPPPDNSTYITRFRITQLLY